MPHTLDLHTRNIWDAINCIPDETLEEYLADGVVDEQEIEDITQRLEAMCQTHGLELNIDDASHNMIRHLVHKAVEYLRQSRPKSGTIEENLSAMTLKDIKQAMGHLLEKGLISGGVDVCHSDPLSHGDSIPEPEEPEEPSDHSA